MLLSEGERNPYLEPPPLPAGGCRASLAKRYLVLGAEATRRMNRDALADILRGDKGPIPLPRERVLLLRLLWLLLLLLLLLPLLLILSDCCEELAGA